MSEEPKMFEAKVSEARKRFGKMKAESDPDFNLETYIAEAQERAQKRADVLNELAPALMKKFQINKEEVEMLLKRSPHFPDLLQAGIGFFAPDARRLANELLSDAPMALAILEAGKKERLAHDELVTIGAQEIRRLMSEAGADPDTFDPRVPFHEEWSEFYQASQETQNYKIARGNAVIQSERYADTFRSWLTQGKEVPEKNLSARELIEATSEFSLHTSQEMTAFSRAQASGKTGEGYRILEQTGVTVWEGAGKRETHRIEIMPLKDKGEAASGILEDVLALTRAQDADAILTTAYILGILAPAPHTKQPILPVAWIDLNDVMKKIGWIPRNAADRREKRKQVWKHIQYGNQARIIGKRNHTYKDNDGREIDTTISHTVWNIESIQAPTDDPNVPVSVEITPSRKMAELLTAPGLAQYFQFGERLGEIPSGNASGAWARVIGIALMAFWRRKPHETEAGTGMPTRRELLELFPAKIAPFDSVLSGTNPTRAIKYWHGAIQHLVDEGLIARTGEAALTPKEMRDGLPRQDWQELWLNEAVEFELSPITAPVVAELAAAKHKPKTRNLSAKPRKKPRKKE